MRSPLPSSRSLPTRALAVACLVLSACAVESTVTEPATTAEPLAVQDALAALSCTAAVHEGTLTCESAEPAGVFLVPGPTIDIFGGQNVNVRLAASVFSYNASSQLYQFDVTIENLLNEAIGTPDGTLLDTAGVKVFFATQPTVTSGTGTIDILNEDGVDTFLQANEPFYQYPWILTQNVASPPRTWQFDVPPTVNTFTFTVFIAATVQPLLVINEVLANPGGTISDLNGEWVEIYNAGTRAVNLLGYVVRDSSPAGTRPPHTITASLVVPSGGYVVLGNTTNTTNNGGVPVDYAYGVAMQLTNAFDRIKITRVFETDSLTIDEVAYAIGSTSAQNGISRELKNPLLPNLDLDGANWADGSVVYGPGGSGTPKARNTAFP